ncbi:MAG: hypothetical protein R3B13_05530 [Polyangiaceae bacterium]
MRTFLISMTTLAASIALSAGCGGSSEDGGNTGGSAGSGATGGGSSGASGSGGASGSSGASGSGGTSGSSGASGGGGISGSGGSSGAGGSGGASPGPECVQASDCKGFQDCCSCMAVPNSVNPPGCDAACTDEKCKVLGVDVNKVECIAGRCVMAFDCDTSKVTCKMAEPQCAAGMTPQVKGNCYTGECVDASQCASVPQCSRCANDEACSVYQTQLGPQNHCVSVPTDCNGDATCACLGPTTCVNGFNSCGNMSGIKGVTCDCPVC